MSKKIIFYISSISLTFNIVAQTKPNVILFIGDGMGPSVTNAARIIFKEKKGRLSWEHFSQVAKVKTYSKDSFVTDSAAGASAMATGYKVNNKSLSAILDKNNKVKQLKTIFELASESGYQTALLTTTDITDATPAAFYSHQLERDEKDTIVESLYNSNLKLIMGGGYDTIKDKTDKLKSKFEVVKNIFNPKICKDRNVIATLADSDLPSVMQKNKKLSLSQLTKLALECLKSKDKPFILVVENEEIDESLHHRKIPEALHAVISLSDAVNEGQKWLSKNNLIDKTLIVVTADHDTAGLSLSDPFQSKDIWIKDKQGNYMIQRAVSKKNPNISFPILKVALDDPSLMELKATHTAVDVDLYATGPGSESFNGLIENTDIFIKIKKILGL